MEIEEVAKHWIEMWRLDVNDPERDKFDWVTDFVRNATHDEPEVGWQLILAILALKPDGKFREVLAAGPLEDLLAYHGDAFIDRVESRARSDPAFTRLLGGVWQNRMSDEVWRRVQAAWDRRGWDGIPGGVEYDVK